MNRSFHSWMQVAVGVESNSLASISSRANYRFTFVAVMQFDVKNVDAQLLKDLQCSSQSTDLVFQCKNNRCPITARQLNFAWRFFFLTKIIFESREILDIWNNYNKLLCLVDRAAFLNRPFLLATSIKPEPQKRFPRSRHVFDNRETTFVLWKLSQQKSC